MNKFLSRKFLLTIFQITALVLPTIFGLISHETSAIISTSLVAIYLIANSVTKYTHNTKDDAILKDFKNTLLPLLEKNGKKN